MELQRVWKLPPRYAPVAKGFFFFSFLILFLFNFLNFFKFYIIWKFVKIQYMFYEEVVMPEYRSMCE